MQVTKNYPLFLTLVIAISISFSGYCSVAPPNKCGGEFAELSVQLLEETKFPNTFSEGWPANLELVSEGAYLSLYTSGKIMRQKRNPKSSVWNVPSRKLKEMWVQKAGDAQMIRLDPKKFRRQLTELLIDYPEIHRAIQYKGFTYKNLPNQIRELNESVAKVKVVRLKRMDMQLNSKRRLEE